MTLEDLEQYVMRYLAQVGNPLVRIDTLIAHLEADGRLAGFSRERLVEFLAQHELIKVLDAQGLKANPRMAAEWVKEGLSLGPYVILNTRMPAPAQIIEMMRGQIHTMHEALEAALDHAREAKDAITEEKVLAAIARAQGIWNKLLPPGN